MPIHTVLYSQRTAIVNNLYPDIDLALQEIMKILNTIQSTISLHRFRGSLHNCVANTTLFLTLKVEKRDTIFELSDEINKFRTMNLLQKTISVTTKGLPIWLSPPIYFVFYIA